MAGTSRATVNQVLREEQERGRSSSGAARRSSSDRDEIARRAR